MEHSFVRLAGPVVVALLFGSTTFGQGRVVLNDNGWIRIDNGAWLVVENPAPTGIQTTGTGGNIRSEDEFNRIRWNIRANTGTYVVPFTTSNGVKMPLSYTVNTAGDNGTNASIAFSTFNYGTIAANNWNNDLYRPTDVTHMNNLTTSLNNSDNVVDRFWIIDPGVAGYAYATRPAVTLGFTYDPGAATGDVRTGNTMTGTTPVGAQRFNSGTGQWGDQMPLGTFTAGAVNTVTGAGIGSAGFFRSWTLSNLTSPLPVELVLFKAECKAPVVVVEWTTASEQGNSHFMVQRSSDGQFFEDIGRVESAQEGVGITQYSFTDAAPHAHAIYRLQQVDLDGTVAYGPLHAVDCTTYGAPSIVHAWDAVDGIGIVLSMPFDQERTLEVYDASGKLLWQTRTGLAQGSTHLMLPGYDRAPGLYVIRSEGPGAVLVRKVVVL